MNFYPDEEDDEDIRYVDDEGESPKEKKPIYQYNPPPFTDGHNPFGEGGIYTPGDPGL